MKISLRERVQDAYLAPESAFVMTRTCKALHCSQMENYCRDLQVTSV